MKEDLEEFRTKGHFPQKRSFSCVPASVRTVIFKKFEDFLYEDYLIEILGTDEKEGGTELGNLINNLNKTKYKAERKRLNIKDIKQKDLPVICFINRDWSNIEKNLRSHAVAIDKIDADNVRILNPGHCTENYARDEFENLHKGGANVVIYISK